MLSFSAEFPNIARAISGVPIVRKACVQWTCIFLVWLLKLTCTVHVSCTHVQNSKAVKLTNTLKHISVCVMLLELPGHHSHVHSHFHFRATLVACYQTLLYATVVSNVCGVALRVSILSYSG